VVILDEIVFLIAPETSFNNGDQTTPEVSAAPSPAGIPEDVLPELITDDVDHTTSGGSGETSGEPEMTLPLNIADGTDGASPLTE
jgi:hypothetical protein